MLFLFAFSWGHRSPFLHAVIFTYNNLCFPLDALEALDVCSFVCLFRSMYIHPTPPPLYVLSYVYLLTRIDHQSNQYQPVVLPLGRWRVMVLVLLEELPEARKVRVRHRLHLRLRGIGAAGAHGNGAAEKHRDGGGARERQAEEPCLVGGGVCIMNKLVEASRSSGR